MPRSSKTEGSRRSRAVRFRTSSNSPGQDSAEDKRQNGAAMKAVVRDAYGSVDVLRLGDVDKPVAGDDEVLVRVHAAGLDQGVWHLMAGMPYMVRLMGFGLRAPKTPVPGGDVAGTVEAVGREVTRFAPGDEVFGTGVGTF